jgi:putative spermidine/putrescine transport system ATP-binding protein
MPHVPNRPHLILNHLTKRYSSVIAVDDLSLDVARGELVALLGPSGCGKTTTLRMVAGLLAPTSGQVVLEDRPITTLPPYRRNMGLVYQNYALFPHLTVGQNIAFGLEMRGLPRHQIYDRVREVLSLVRLDGFEQRRIRQLSGGQQQRVALARALVIRPAVLLLDEPLSNLDAKLREEMRIEIREIQRKLRITTLFVTHDQTEALTIADRVAVMNHGRLEQVGSPQEIYESPASLFVATFIGRANLIRGIVVDSGPDRALVRTEGGNTVAAPRPLPRSSPVTLLIRPHRIRLASAKSDTGLQGMVRRVTYQGDLVRYEVATAAGTIVVERPTDEIGVSFQVGDEVSVLWRPQEILVFDNT